MATAAHVYLEYETMLKSFRCQDLANLLASAGQSKNGKKSELYERCISILRKGNVNVQSKIRDLYSQLQGQKNYGGYGTTSAYISGINSNSNSSTSNSPDPTMVNGGPSGLQRYQPPQQQQSAAVTAQQPASSSSSSTHGGFLSQNSNFYNNNNNRQAAAAAAPSMIGLTLPGTSYNPAAMMTAAAASGAPNAGIGLRSVQSQQQQSANSNGQFRVQFEKLAFFKFLHELAAPIRLIPNPPNQRVHAFNFNFTMTTEQASQITANREVVAGKYEYTKQIHLRMGLFEHSHAQSDNLPPNLIINVNGKPAQLPTPKPTSKPNADVVRPGRTIEITPICKLAPNVINRVEINWSVAEPHKPSYCIGVYILEKVSVDTLVKTLKATGVKSADVTRDMIKQKLHIGDDDFEIETNTYKVSLCCPLMKFRMQIPCRSTKCRHAQCFNLESYLQMNEKKPTWNCPVCDQNASYDSLMIDSLFVELLEQCKDCDEVEFSADGTWTRCDGKDGKSGAGAKKSGGASTLKTSASTQNLNSSSKSSSSDIMDCVDLDDSVTLPSSAVPLPAPAQPAKSATTLTSQPAVAAAKEADCIDLTLDSDEEDHAPPAPPPPSKRPPQPQSTSTLTTTTTTGQQSVSATRLAKLAQSNTPHLLAPYPPPPPPPSHFPVTMATTTNRGNGGNGDEHSNGMMSLDGDESCVEETFTAAGDDNDDDDDDVDDEIQDGGRQFTGGVDSTIIIID